MSTTSTEKVNLRVRPYGYDDRLVPDPLLAVRILRYLQQYRDRTGSLANNMASAIGINEYSARDCLLHLEKQGFVTRTVQQVGTAGTMNEFWNVVPDVNVKCDIEITRPFLSEPSPPKADPDDFSLKS